MADKLGVSVDVAQNETDTHYLPGWPHYDAVRLDVDSSSTGSADSTVTISTYSKNDVRDAKDNDDFSSMDAVQTDANVDASSGDPSYGTDEVSRVIAVRVAENANMAAGITGTIYLHERDDPEQSKEAFLARNGVSW